MHDRLKDLARALVRRVTPVDATGLARTKPISSRFGLDRGTPIDRYYIERFLAQHRSLIRGDVMEIGARTYSQQFGSGVEHSYVLHATSDNAQATHVGDLTDRASLPASLADCFICTQTLNFIYDVDAAVHGLHHVLRPGGTVLATVAGISQISRYDMDRWGDYWRFTDASLRRLFGNVFSDVKIETTGNVAAAVALLQGIAVEDLPDPRALDATDPDYPLVLTVVARKAPA